LAKHFVAWNRAGFFQKTRAVTSAEQVGVKINSAKPPASLGRAGVDGLQARGDFW